MGRIALIVALGLCVAGCDEPVAGPDYPAGSCADVGKSIEQQPGVKNSEALSNVETLACSYGMSVATTQTACATAPAFSDYLGDAADNKHFGLNAKTATALTQAYRYGDRIAHAQAMWASYHGASPTNPELCETETGRLHDSYASLVKATEELRENAR